MTEEEFRKKEIYLKEISIVDDKFEMYEGFRNKSIIDKKFNEAKELFLKIYNEYIESDGFKEYLQEKEEALKKLDEARQKWEKTETYKVDPDLYAYKSDLRRLVNQDFLNVPPEDRLIYDDFSYLNNQWKCYRNDYSVDFEKYEMKISLLKKYLDVSKFPSDWYYHENFKEEGRKKVNNGYYIT